MTTIRPAESDDFPAVAALLAEAGLPLAGVQAHIRDFVVAEAVSVIGCAGLERYGEAALLRSVAVAESARGAGIGQRLTRACIDAARASGVATLVLLTETADEFFPRFGFVAVERAALPEAVQQSEEFRGACSTTAVAMVLGLGPSRIGSGK
jgi:amino-acid N-acetyltransferase